MLIPITGREGSAAERGRAAVALRERASVGRSTQVSVGLKAHGLFRPGPPIDAKSDQVKMPKPLALEIQTRLIFHERVIEVDGESARASEATTEGTRPAVDALPVGTPIKAVRHVVQAASAINGEIRPTSATLRPELAVLIAQRRDVRAPEPVTVVAAAGSLSRSELELVQSVGDPLVLVELLPDHSVSVGDSWRISEMGARAITGYDVITASKLEASLESSDPSTSRIRITGEVRGSALGGIGVMKCDGSFTFDHAALMIDRLEINRDETRQPGPVEAGLDVKSTLTVTRAREVAPATISETALAKMSLEITPNRELLRLIAPAGKAVLFHDRRWHSFWDDPKLIVMKRLDRGKLIAQLNLAVGPPAGKGRHQDHNQFREDIRRALKDRFGQFIGAGLVDGDPKGGFRYKVGVQGRDGELPVVWYYYLLAGPDGDQMLATFTMARDDAAAFGDEDMAIIATLRWLNTPANPPETTRKTR
jgi:hypothetical protein